MRREASLRRRRNVRLDHHIVNREKIKRDIVVIGASAGGVMVLQQLFSTLPNPFPGSLMMVIHRGPVPSQLVAVLGRRSTVPITEVERVTAPEPNTVYVAPADHHLLVQHGKLAIDRGPKEHGTRPSVDPMFRTAAVEFGSRVVGVILTGCGDDGVAGLVSIKQEGGLSLVQNPDEAYMPSMPKNAIEYDHVDMIVSLADISSVLAALARGEEVKIGGTRKKPMPHTLAT
jgi:two-component system, chemotaxis family, protein-glutamate methylesterase/glutaminase